MKCNPVYFIALLGLATMAQADYQLASDRVRVICGDDVEQSYCRDIAERAEPLLQQAETLLNHRVDTVNIVVGNVSDQVNGAATVLPSNLVYLYTSYPREGILLSMDDWLNSVIFHELIHVVQLSQSSGFARGVESVFGRHFFTVPNAIIPRWLAEGIAVWAESSVVDGRATSPYYLGQLRMLTQAGLPRVEDLAVNAGVPVQGDQYLIGSAFMRFISDRYGNDTVARWVHTMGAKPIAGFYDVAYQQTTGNRLTDDWQAFEQWLTVQATAELAAIGEPVAGTTLASGRIGAPRVGPNGELWYVQGAVEAPAMLISANQAIELPSAVFDIQFRDGAWQALRSRTCGQREGVELVAYLDQRWQVVSRCHGIVALVPGGSDYLIRFTGQTYQLENAAGEIIPTPAMVLAAAQANEQLVVLVQEGLQRELYQRVNNKWLSLNLAEFHPQDVVISDGDIYFISGKNGVDNIWRAYDQTPVTRVQGGVRDLAVSGETLWFRQLHPNGFALQQLDAPAPVDSPILPQPVQTSANLTLAQAQPITAQPRHYVPTLALRPINWLPILGGTSAQPSFGANVNFADATGRHNASMGGQTDGVDWQLDLAYQLPKWSFAGRIGQVNGSLDEASDWRVQASFADQHELGLGLHSQYQLLAQTDDHGYRVGAGAGLANLRYATYGVLPRQGSSINALSSWGNDSGARVQGYIDWYRQLGPVYYQFSGTGIWDNGGEASIADSLSEGQAGLGLAQVSVAHPGVLDLAESATVWQQRNKLLWGSQYRPRGLGLSPVGYTRYGVSAGTLVSGNEQAIAASASAGFFVDWALLYGIAPVRTELVSVFGLDNADWALALNVGMAP